MENETDGKFILPPHGADNGEKGMKPTEKKHEFIKLRADGYSLRSIEKEINTSRSTLSKWEKELKDDIEQLKQDNLIEVYNAYGMTKTARIERLGKVLDRLKTSIDQIDLDDIPPAKLIELYLKYSDALKAEYRTPREKTTFNDDVPNKIVAAAAETFNAIRAGEIDSEQAKQEMDALSNLLKAYDTAEIKTKIEAIEELLELRGKTDDNTATG